MSYLKIQLNQPTQISLKYPTGKECENKFKPGEKQLRWMLMNGQDLYTPLEFGTVVKQLGIRAGERFTVTKLQKGRGIEWTAERLAQPIAQVLDGSEDLHNPHGAELAAVPTRKPPTRLEHALKTAVSAAAAAEEHAKSLGYTCRFTSGDIRAMGISVLIGMEQSGGRHAA
jgi:hypothetical protein